MNCYNHRQTAAIGLCKSCGKALCPDCIEEVPDGLACKASCVERVKLLNRIVDNNQRILAVTNVHIRSNTVFLIIMGSLFGLFGLVPFWITGKPFSLFFTLMGALFLVSGLLRLRPKARYPEIKS